MTYCLGIRTHEGLVLASDSRTNAGIDQINVCCKMHSFVVPGERVTFTFDRAAVKAGRTGGIIGIKVG